MLFYHNLTIYPADIWATNLYNIMFVCSCTMYALCIRYYKISTSNPVLIFFFRRRRALCLYTIINNNKIVKKCVLTFRTTGVHDSDERLLIRTAACVCYIYYIYILYHTYRFSRVHNMKSGQGFQNPLWRWRRQR